MILVTAANGNQGKLLVPKLIAAGQAVRAWVNSERSAEAVRKAGVAEFVVGAIDDPETMARAVRGADKVHHICPTMHPREREIGMALIDAAKAEGVKHFVFSSVLHPIITDLVQHPIKRDIEEHLLASGLPFTILQPTIYMAPFKMKTAFERGFYSVAWSPDRLQSLVDIGDVAEVVATVLANTDVHVGATYELAGNGRYTAYDMAAVISKVVGREIPVKEIDIETFLNALFGYRDRSTLQHEEAAVRSLNVSYSAADFVGNPNVLTWLLGRAPTSFETFVAGQYAAFEAAAAQA
jgi:uncharacterized protein YbjT (DUF2867 family)